MNKIGLITDGAADLPEEFIEKNQIAIVPVKMEWPEIEGLPGNNIFQRVREAEKRGMKTFGKTSQPSPKDFLIAYKKQLENFENIICITVTSKLSGTYNSAIQAKNFLTPDEAQRIFVIDSLNASSGEGLLVFKAAGLISEGKSREEVIQEIENFVPVTTFYGMFMDPKWLEASGRISHTLANWVRRAEKIGLRPLLGMKQGVLKSMGIKRGAKSLPEALFREIESKTKKSREKGKKIIVAIAHGDNVGKADSLKEMIEKKLKGCEVVHITLIDNVLAVLAGPDALVFGWYEA
jgi:DegV family protein with EDD domain